MPNNSTVIFQVLKHSRWFKAETPDLYYYKLPFNNSDCYLVKLSVGTHLKEHAYYCTLFTTVANKTIFLEFSTFCSTSVFYKVQPGRLLAEC